MTSLFEQCVERVKKGLPQHWSVALTLSQEEHFQLLQIITKQENMDVVLDYCRNRHRNPHDAIMELSVEGWRCPASMQKHEWDQMVDLTFEGNQIDNTYLVGLLMYSATQHNLPHMFEWITPLPPHVQMKGYVIPYIKNNCERAVKSNHMEVLDAMMTRLSVWGIDPTQIDPHVRQAYERHVLLQHVSERPAPSPKLM